jgi:hypothetical protein
MDPCGSVLLQKVTGLPLVMTYSAVYENTNIHYCIYSAPSFVNILSQINPTYALPPYLFNIHLILSYHLCPGLQSGPFPLGFPTKILYALLFSPYLQHVPRISSSFIWPPKTHSVTSSLQITTQYSPVSCYFRPLRVKAFLQNLLSNTISLSWSFPFRAFFVQQLYL